MTHTTRPDETLFPQIRELYTRLFPDSALERIEPLPADMSLRRYFRLKRSGPSLIAMAFDSRNVPEVSGGSGPDSYEAVLLLREYLARRGIPVPRLLGHSSENSIIIEEDLGDRFLADELSADPKTALGHYREAIDLIVGLQAANPDKSFFALQRGFTAENYVREMEEIRDFYFVWKLGPQKLPESLKQALAECFEDLARRLVSQRQVLALRDFHSWNLMITPQGKLAVIDYQDALIATRSYDVAALLNDRDTDSLLGEQTSFELLEYFFNKHPQGNELRGEYPLVLLQRDLKVAGRLAKMVVTRGLKRYERWIPGTAQRIRRTLLSEKSSPSANGPLFSRLLELLASVDRTFRP